MHFKGRHEMDLHAGSVEKLGSAQTPGLET